MQEFTSSQEAVYTGLLKKYFNPPKLAQTLFTYLSQESQSGVVNKGWTMLGIAERCCKQRFNNDKIILFLMTGQVRSTHYNNIFSEILNSV